MSLRDQLNLNDFVCFALYSASRSMTQLYRAYLERRDLTYPQFLVLFLLWRDDGCAVSTISDTLLLDGGTVTPLLKRMETKGLVRRQRDEDDERVVRIFLTDAGRSLEHELLEDVARGMLCDLDMNVSEVAGLAARIHKLRETIDRAVVRKASEGTRGKAAPAPTTDDER